MNFETHPDLAGHIISIHTYPRNLTKKSWRSLFKSPSHKFTLIVSEDGTNVVPGHCFEAPSDFHLFRSHFRYLFRVKEIATSTKQTRISETADNLSLRCLPFFCQPNVHLVWKSSLWFPPWRCLFFHHCQHRERVAYKSNLNYPVSSSEL